MSYDQDPFKHITPENIEKLKRLTSYHVDLDGRECAACGIYKTWEKFRVNRQTLVRRTNKCRDCLTEIDRERARKYREKKRLEKEAAGYVRNTSGHYVLPGTDPHIVDNRLIDDEGQECRTCGEYKPYTEYHRNSRYDKTNNGYEFRCKECANEHRRALRKNQKANRDSETKQFRSGNDERPNDWDARQANPGYCSKKRRAGESPSTPLESMLRRKIEDTNAKKENEQMIDEYVDTLPEFSYWRINDGASVLYLKDCHLRGEHRDRFIRLLLTHRNKVAIGVSTRRAGQRLLVTFGPNAQIAYDWEVDAKFLTQITEEDYNNESPTMKIENVAPHGAPTPLL